MYLLSDEAEEDGVPLLRMLSPSPSVNGGSAAYSAGQPIETAWYRLDERAGTETQRSRIILVDRRGKTDVVLETHEGLQSVSASPDGAQLALWIAGANDMVRVYDIGRKTMTRLSFVPGDAMDPVWTPDGVQITFATTDPDGLTSVAADGSGQERRLITSESTVPGTWSPDGRHIAFVQSHPQTQNDIWTFSTADAKPTPFLITAAGHGGAYQSAVPAG